MNLHAELDRLEEYQRVALRNAAREAIDLGAVCAVSPKAEDHIHMRVREIRQPVLDRMTRYLDMLPPELRSNETGIFTRLVEQMLDESELRNILLAERMKLRRFQRRNSEIAAQKRRDSFRVVA